MKKNTKQKIIDSAIDLFSKDSYGKVSIAQICKNAKISNGIIYNYFRNKEEHTFWRKLATGSRSNLKI
ncbi:MAG: hypothetical protein B6227_04365 [Fusobacteriia bacterium 4572_74]|nr:MAG: hypothetical protein B6227_04365 [Fusobacteriia bacterium 4572_74]